MVNGTAVWDGGSVTTKNFTRSQTSLLDQWLSPSSGTEGETKERMKEPSSEKEDHTSHEMDKEQLMTVLHGETKKDAGVKMSEGQSVVKERETEMRDQQQRDGVETLKQEEITILYEVPHGKQNTGDGNIFLTESNNSEGALSAQLKCLQTKDVIQETTSPVHKPTQSIEVLETPTQITECWDEYTAHTADDMQVGTSSSEMAFASLFYNVQTHSNLSGQHNAQAGWHFAVGPGLAEEVRCPLWQFPAASYYPPVEQTLPFEGENLIYLFRRTFLDFVFSIVISTL